jgi:phenylalanyl-tRNA synthetase beta chain
MKLLTNWLRSYLPPLAVTDQQLAEDLTLRGIAVDGVFALAESKGSLFEMDVTTNRVDAMNHYGVAREAAAIYGLELKPLAIDLAGVRPTQHPFPVRIEAPELCGRFTIRVLRDAKIGESKGIAAEYFGLLEQKSISNAVDATNFVWMAMGQPTHAFDLDKVEGAIVVRRARKGEKLKTLDGVERNLDPDDLVIADEKKALSLAGVMGGWDSMITPETKNVLVEAAWFDPASVRRTARRHGLHTDASHRFERGADFNAAPTASSMVCQLILENGGYVEGPLVDVVISEAEGCTAKRTPITLSVAEVQRILGTTIEKEGITAQTVETVLSALGCTLVKQGREAYKVALPSWRLDLEREIDLIEEIARVYGYNRFANTLPAFSGAVVQLPWAEKETAVRRTLLALGFHEAISSTFISATEAATFSPQPSSAVHLGNPLNEEAGMLRSSLVPGMLTMLAGNLNRDVDDVRLFELGTAFSGTTERVEERPSLTVGVAGAVPAIGPHQASRVFDFYDLKGAVEELLSKFSSKSIYFDCLPSDSGLMPEWLHPGRSARVVLDGTTIGYFGQLHPVEAARRKLKQQVLLGEFSLDRLYRQTLHQPASKELSRFQLVRRDFSLILPEKVQWTQIAEAMQSLKIPEMVGFTPREIFRDKRLAAGEYALLLGASFQSAETTLREEQVQAFSDQILAAMASLGGRLRS